MNKTLFSTLVAALVCVAGSAKAADGISSSTLSQMGLSGLTVMSDRDALAVRGLGFSLNSCCGPRGSISPSAEAIGLSNAQVNLLGLDGTASSHSENSYHADGAYSASGTNYSEAGWTTTKAEIVDGIGGLVTTCTTKVWAGGNSSAKAF